MDLVRAVAAGGLAIWRNERRFAATESETEAEIRAAERRVRERRDGAPAASGRHEVTERGRHAAPRAARA